MVTQHAGLTALSDTLVEGSIVAGRSVLSTRIRLFLDVGKNTATRSKHSQDSVQALRLK